MNTQVNIIAAVIIAIIFLPIYFLNKTGYTYLKKLTKKFNDIAANNNLKINQKECWANTCIGIDTTQHKLLYKRGLENNDNIIVDLEHINSCELVKSVDQRRVDKVFVHQLVTLDLKLTVKKSKVPILLNFYDVANNYPEDFELKRIEKWLEIIKANLSPERIKKVA